MKCAFCDGRGYVKTDAGTSPCDVCSASGAYEAYDAPYVKCARDIGRLVTEKQAAYGDSFGRAGEILRVLYPNGVQPAQYEDMLAVVRILDKLFRVATDRDALGENPYRDIAGYGILGASRIDRQKAEKAR